MLMDIFNMVGASFLVVLFLMVSLWIFYLFQGNGGIVDIGWGVGFILTAWVYFILGAGDFFKMLVLTLMVTIWAGRLTSHIYIRFNQAKEEDPRYRHLRESWGGDSTYLLFLMLFIFQGVLVVILSLPFLLVSLGSHASWSMWEFLGILFWLTGLLGEATADRQLSRFNKDPLNKGKVCQVGWWRFSRHPNYFFEAMVWVGFFLFAFPSDGGGLGILSPLIMLILLLKVSGIPLAEAGSLRSKGDLYREYQRTTSAFVPWFPKK